VQKDLYLLECADGSWIDLVETETLKQLEDRFAPVVEEIITERRLPTVASAPFVELLRLVVMMLYRTTVMRDQLNAIVNNVVVAKAREDFDSGRYRARFMREHGQEPTADDARQYQQAIEALGRGDIAVDINPSAWVELMTRAINENGPSLASRKWSLLCARADAPDFICSDSPVTLSLRKPDLYPCDFHPGLRALHTWIVMPLNRRNTLIGSHEDDHPRGPADTKVVGFINKTIIENANRFLYSPGKEIVWKLGRRLLGTNDLAEWLDRTDESPLSSAQQ